jgi:calcineurin-like phosphoesterase family protein
MMEKFSSVVLIHGRKLNNMTKWLGSDHHFFHEKPNTEFKRSDGITFIRPFGSADVMNREIIRRHNEVVKPDDIFWCLGDFCMGDRAKNLYITRELNGRKFLIKGNHDSASAQLYLDNGFEDVLGVKEFSDMILSHVPLHPLSLGRFHKNLHGHLHDSYYNDPNYLCVSLEHTGFYPISYDEVKIRFRENERSFKQTGKVIDFSARYL